MIDEIPEFEPEHVVNIILCLAEAEKNVGKNRTNALVAKLHRLGVTWPTESRHSGDTVKDLRRYINLLKRKGR
jgi:hypothetical protein